MHEIQRRMKWEDIDSSDFAQDSEAQLYYCRLKKSVMKHRDSSLRKRVQEPYKKEF